MIVATLFCGFVGLTRLSGATGFEGGCARTIAVCTNKHCVKHGASHTLDLFHELATHTTVEATGCQGACQTGPNVMASNERLFTAVTRPVTVAAVLELCDDEPISERAISALEERAKGDASLRRGSVETAIAQFTRAIDELDAYPRAMASSLVRRSDAHCKAARGRPEVLALAHADAKRATEVCPDFGAGWWRLSRMLVKQSLPHHAIDALHCLVERVPDAAALAKSEIRLLQASIEEAADNALAL